jgi:APA family basic amino acid/polyamine antiporter
VGTTVTQVHRIQAEAQSTGLPRTLGVPQPVLLGIGCIVGAGIYVLPDIAAAISRDRAS